jgi:TRAP-type C4-dicarboxylate transport system permease small subunit
MRTKFYEGVEVMKSLVNWIDGITKVAAAISAVLVGVMVIQIVVDAIVRSMFHSPLPGTLEIMQYAWMPAAIALGLGYALYRGEHIRVDLLTSGAGERTRQVLEMVAMAVTLIAVVLVAWAGFESAMDSMAKNEASQGYRWIIIWPGRLAVAVGLLALALQTLAQLVRAFANELPVSAEEAAVRGDEADLLAEPALEMTPRGTEMH